jgi:5-formyltetrahydrofolate cyclo-ligase
MEAGEQPNDLAARKQRIRDVARQKRQAQSHRDWLSHQILDHCRHLAEYTAAQTVLYYLDTRFEVCTREELARALTTDKTIVVPYCEQGPPGLCRLGLCRLTAMSELERGMYGIEEPSQEIRADACRFVEAEGVDLVVVPGVAFDRSGRRLGYGRGYYDELLQRLRPDTATIGLAFECQLFAELPHEPHDVPVDMVITERGVYR